MSYTVFGLFPNEKECNDVLTKLENAGFYDYTISHTEKEALESVDNKKKGFWHWLFDNSTLEQDRYEYASVDSDTVTVYVDNEDDANAVKNILDENGAIDIEEKTRDYISGKYADTHHEYPISESKRARIIAKAKNDLYFTDERQAAYTPEKGMSDEMDSQGKKD
ncbi:MAG: hypothetical protein BGO86_10115 [Chryseobacterium sp. 36-9]|nr:MAG: hypothetical protein BGO86_10115 [Chryseobacterium sp. 36-9]